MSDFLNDQYVMPPAVYPPRNAGVVPPGAPVPVAPPQERGGSAAHGIVPVFDSRPTNTQDIYREFVNAINFVVPQGFTFILRKISAAAFADSALTKPVIVETGLRLNVTINGIASVLSDTGYGFASHFDAPVFVTIPESQVLGGNVVAKGPLLGGTYNAWLAVTPAPPVGYTWGRTAQWLNTSITISQGNNIAAYTLDGKNFLYNTMPAAVGDIAAYGTVWMAIDWAAAFAYTSTDGITWTTRAIPAVCNAVGGGAGRWLVYSGVSNLMYLSLNNGMTWSAGVALPGVSGFVQRIIYNADAGLYVARTAGGANIQVWSSPDGITWTLKYTVALAAGSNTIEYANGVYIADFNNGLYRSTDLVTWTLVQAVNLNVPQYGSGVKYSNGVWRTIAIAGNIDYVSTDNGLTWASEYNPSAAVGSIGAIGDVFYELQGATGYALTVQNATQAAQGGLSMKFSMVGQLIPNTALPANMANRG